VDITSNTFYKCTAPFQTQICRKRLRIKLNEFRPVQTLVDITFNTFYKCTATFRTHCINIEGVSPTRFDTSVLYHLQGEQNKSLSMTISFKTGILFTPKTVHLYRNIPEIDRFIYLLTLGSNPYGSNAPRPYRRALCAP
jgi:hypothetical protein